MLALDLAVLLLHVESFGLPLNARSDPREKLAVLSTLRQAGPAYAAVMPHLLFRSNGLATGTDRVFPVAGISRVMTVLTKESGSWTKYLSDEHGFNNPPGCYSSDTSPIVLIGDSFVHGARVPNDDITAEIRDLGHPAINLGFAYDGPLLELATLSEYGLKLRPRAVIWVYFEGNDLAELAEERSSPLLRAYLHDGYSQHLAERQNLIDQLLKRYSDAEEQKLMEKYATESQAKHGSVLKRVSQTSLGKVIRIIHLRGLLKSWHKERKMVSLGWHNTRVINNELPLFQKILSVAERRAKEVGAKFYFVYLPDENRFRKGLAHNRDWEQRARILSIIESLKIPCLDLSEDFARQPDPLSLYISRSFSSHLNATGDQFVARACLKRLQADGN